VEEKIVAIYLDFENLAISALEAYRGVEKPLKIEPLIRFASTKGNLKVKKVYADWSKKKFSQYQKELLINGFELIHLPETNLLGKNGSDMRLVIDVMEHLYEEPKPDVVLIGSGDSDFIPLIQHIQNKNTEVVLLSFEHSVSEMIKHYCSEFQPLKPLIGEQEPRKSFGDHRQGPSPANRQNANYRKGKHFLQRYLKQRKEPKESISLSELKQDILRFDPEFSEEDFGFLKFKKFIKAYRGDLIEDLEKKDKQWWVQLRKEKKADATKAKVLKDSKAFAEARELVLQLIRSRKQDVPLPMARFKPLLTRLNPDFSEKKLGYRYFKQFAEDLVGDLVDKITEDGYTLYVHFKVPEPQLEEVISEPEPVLSTAQHEPHNKAQNGIATLRPKIESLDVKKAENPAKSEAKTYLEEELLFQPALSDRLLMSGCLLQGMQMYPGMTVPQMNVYLQIHTGLPDDENIFEKYVTLLQQNDLFDIVKGKKNSSNVLFRLKPEFNRPDKLDEAYIEVIGKELSEKFSELDTADILDLLFSLSHSDVTK
jgi:hypothetical protein